MRNSFTSTKHRNDPHDRNEYYSFAEDFLYDSFPLSPQTVDERNGLDFPLDQMGAKLRCAMETIFGLSAEAGKQQEDQFQELVWDLEKIGLRGWLKNEHFTQELEEKFPTGRIAVLQDVDLQRQASAKFMLRCASRGKNSLLDFEAVNPQTLMHGRRTS